MCSDTSITISTFTTSNIGDLTSFHWELGWHLQVLSQKREIKGTTSLKKILATIEPIKLAVLRDMSQTIQSVGFCSATTMQFKLTLIIYILAAFAVVKPLPGDFLTVDRTFPWCLY